MMFNPADLLHRRDDGTFVIQRNGMPYHVTTDDALYAEVAAAAEGVDLPPEPVPEPVAPPPPSRIITPRQFMDRLPMERQAAITAAAMQSPQILLWLIRLTGALQVDLDDPETLEGVQALHFAEIITETEAEALLA